MSKVIVYSAANCAGCSALKRNLTAKGVEYVEKRIDEDLVARDRILAEGFKRVPVLEIEDFAISCAPTAAQVDQLLKGAGIL